MADVIVPLHLPDNGGQGADSCEPYAACTKRGGIAKSYVAWFTYNEFTTVGWVQGEDAEEDAKVT